MSAAGASGIDERAANALPPGYAAVDLDPGQAGAPLRIAVLFRREPDAGGGHLVVLRDLLVGRALLGCLVDAGDVVHDWVEVWIQDPGCLEGSPAVRRETLTNAALDERWKAEAEAAEALDPTQVIRTGWETEHPLPTLVDRARLVTVHPRDRRTGALLRLCEDDAALTAAGLPPFRSSCHRYLIPEGEGPATEFVPVGAGAPRTEATPELAEIVDRTTEHVPLNPGGGLVQVRRHSPIRLEQYVDVLGGATWKGVFHGTSLLPLAAAFRGLTQATMTQRLAEGHLGIASGGRSSRLIEVLHLKLRLLADAAAAVHASVRVTNQPLLNLTSDGFQVRLGAVGSGLPFLWTTRVVLARPGVAIALPIEGSEMTYLLSGRAEESSVYQPASGRRLGRGETLLRIRKAIAERDGALVLEGTLDTHESVEMSDSDFLWMRVATAGGGANVFARVDRGQAMAAGEIRFRSVPQRFEPPVAAALRALEGVPVDRVPWEVIPLLTTPCDLYSLGVLAVRILLTGGAAALPVALDETLSLARQCAEEHDAQVPLERRIDLIFDRDGRWVESLGPQRLVADGPEPADAFDHVPRRLWIATLAAIVRTFPGIGPDSVCRDLGDAPPGGLHKVFDPLLADLERLLVRSRSLIVVDWAANREIHAVIRRYAMGQAAAGAGAASSAAGPAPG